MKTTKTLLVICAMGYATSTMIKKSITEFFEEKGINDWDVDAISLGMSKDYVGNVDLIVSSLELKQSEYDVPVMNGVPLISGIGKDAMLADILSHVNAIDNRKA